MKSRYLGSLYMALAASIWGGMYVVSKIMLANIQPLALLWLRYIVALLAMVPIMFATRQSWRIHWRHVPLVVSVGIIGYALSIWAQFQGTALSTAQWGSLITSATPAFMVVFGRLILGESITLRKAVSVGIATLGVLLVIGLGGVNHSYELGGLILFIAALTWALMSVLVKRVPLVYPSLTVTLYAILTATVVITPMAMNALTHMPLHIWTRSDMWGGLIYIGVISTAGAFFLWNNGLQRVDASSGGLFFFFQPLVGTFLGWIVLGESVTLSFWLGAAMILLSVLLVIKGP